MHFGFVAEFSLKTKKKIRCEKAEVGTSMCMNEVATSLSPLKVDIVEINKMSDNGKSRDQVRTKPLVPEERSRTKRQKQ